MGNVVYAMINFGDKKLVGTGGSVDEAVDSAFEPLGGFVPYGEIEEKPSEDGTGFGDAVVRLRNRTGRKEIYFNDICREMDRGRD